MSKPDEFKKFPKKHGEIHPIYYQKEIDEWRKDTLKKLEKAKKDLNEILDSELMKQAERVVPRVRERWEGQLTVVEELLVALNDS